jgi:formylglycine-generating enzyme required for sulfatase activity
MHGNVWEWCRDIKQPTLPGGIDPLAAGTDENRVIRAGSWRDAPNRLRSAYRYGVRPFHRKYYLGARLAIVPD